MTYALLALALALSLFAVVMARRPSQATFHVKHVEGEEHPQILQDALEMWQLMNLDRIHSRRHMQVRYGWTHYRWNRASALINWAGLRTMEVDYHHGVRMLKSAFRQQAENSRGNYVLPFSAKGSLWD